MRAKITGSVLNLTLTDDDTGQVYDLAGEFSLVPSLTSVPAAKWGVPPDLAGGMAGAPEANSLLNGFLTGFSTITPNTVTLSPNGAGALDIDVTTAFADEVINDQDSAFLPLSATTAPTGVVPQPDANVWGLISSSLGSDTVTQARADVYTALVAQFGIDPLTNGPLSNLAARPGAYLNGNPMVLS
jgi:hypothetical protein